MPITNNNAFSLICIQFYIKSSLSFGIIIAIVFYFVNMCNVFNNFNNVSVNHAFTDVNRKELNNVSVNHSFKGVNRTDLNKEKVMHFFCDYNNSRCNNFQ